MQKTGAVYLVASMALLAMGLSHLMTQLAMRDARSDIISAIARQSNQAALELLNAETRWVKNTSTHALSRRLSFDASKGVVTKGQSLDRELEFPEDAPWGYAWLEGRAGNRHFVHEESLFVLSGSGDVVRASKLAYSVLPRASLDAWQWGLGILAVFFWLGLLHFQPTSRSLLIGGGIFATGWCGVLFQSLRDYMSQLNALALDLHTNLSSATLIFSSALVPIVIACAVGIRNQGKGSPHRHAYAYLLPAALSMLLLVFIPFLLGVGLAFTRYAEGTYHWVGLDNFVRIIANEGLSVTHPLSFYFTLAVTILWTVINVGFHTSIGLALALALNQPALRFKGIYRVLLILPWAVPSYITALVWHGMFNPTQGVINVAFEFAGISQVAWFDHFWTAFTANVVTNTWLGFPFMMVVSLGALQSIPRDLYEAARVDGATNWTCFKSITVPLLRPALMPSVILGAVWTFNMFNVIYLVSGGGPSNQTDILITEAYRWAFEKDRYGYAAAYSMLIFLILLTYSFVTQKLTSTGEDNG